MHSQASQSRTAQSLTAQSLQPRLVINWWHGRPIRVGSAILSLSLGIAFVVANPLAFIPQKMPQNYQQEKNPIANQSKVYQDLPNLYSTSTLKWAFHCRRYSAPDSRRRRSRSSLFLHLELPVQVLALVGKTRQFAAISNPGKKDMYNNSKHHFIKPEYSNSI